MLRKAIGVLVGGGIVIVSAGSCVRNDASLIIMGMLAPPVSASSGSTSSCLYQAVITGPFISTGVMDLAFTQEYEPVLLLGNQLVPQGNAALDKIETNNINVQGAVVSITDASGASVGASYTAPASAFLQPSSGGTPGLATLAVPLISPQAAATVGTTFTGTKRLISTVYVFGTTSGGTQIESNQAQFEVDACVGCLVVYPQAADDPTLAKQPNCAASGSTGGSSITVPCVMGQDQPIDCRLCSTTNPVCQL